MTEEFQDGVAPPPVVQLPPPEPPPEPPPLPPPERPKRGRRGGLALLVLILAAVVVGLAGTARYWLPPLLPGGDDQRLASDEARLARLEAQPRPAPAEPAALAPLQARVASLEARGPAAPDMGAVTDAAQKAGADAAQKAGADAAQKLSARLDTLETRVGTLAAAESHDDPRAAAMLAALADLRAAFAGSGPFADELAVVQSLGGDGTTLQPLAAAAKTGIPDRALLAERFRAVTAPAIEDAASAAPAAEPDDFGARVLARLEGLVTVRRIGGADNPSVAAVRDAETALDRGDLAGAVAALKPLTGTEAEAARAFVADAQARLDAEHAVSDLTRQQAAKLGDGGKP